MWFDRREDQRRRPQIAIIAARRPVLHFSGGPVIASELASVNNIGIEWIGSNIGVLVGPHRMPFAKRDLAIVAAAGHARRSAFLLPSIHPIGALIIGNDVIELRGRLIVPGAPGSASVHRDCGALVGSEKNDFRMIGVDPD